MNNSDIFFLHLDSILAEIFDQKFGCFGPKPPMGKLTTVPISPDC